MAVYDFDVTTTIVADELGFLTLDTNSEPPSTTVDRWITQYAGELGTALYDSQGIDASDITSTTDADFYETCRLNILKIVTARWQAANERDAVELYVDAQEEWRAFLGRVRAGQIGRLAASRVRSQINPEITDDNYAPFWTKRMDL